MAKQLCPVCKSEKFVGNIEPVSGYNGMPTTVSVVYTCLRCGVTVEVSYEFKRISKVKYNVRPKL